VRNNDTYGVIKVDLRPTGFDWEFVPEAGKTFTDSGSDECHDANGPLSASGSPLNAALVTGTTFTDTTAQNGTTYSYTVTAVDEAGQESPPSNTASATPSGTNQAPVFSTNLADRTDAEGDSVSLDADASDADNDPLTYSATGLPGGITINASTGVISGTLSSTSSGSHAVTVTVSDGSLSDTDTFTWTVTEPATLTVHANDGFGRTLVNTWGSAPTGGAYTLQGNAADYDVDGSLGTIVLGAAGANRSAVLASVSARDVDLSLRVASDKAAVGGAQFVYGLMRRVNAQTEYRAKVRLATNGRVFVQASSVVSGAERPIGTEVEVTGLTHTPGGFIRLRAQVEGASPTTIRIRAWADGAAEPSTWQYTATDSATGLQVAGAVGVRAYLSSATTNAPILLSFDDFRVTSIAQ
jgi:chitodextrinase